MRQSRKRIIEDRQFSLMMLSISKNQQEVTVIYEVLKDVLLRARFDGHPAESPIAILDEIYKSRMNSFSGQSDGTRISVLRAALNWYLTTVDQATSTE